MGDLFIAEFFGRAEEAISSIADDHVDAAEFGEGLIHDLADFRQVGHVEMREPQLIAVFALKIVHRVHLADGARHTVTAFKEPLSHETAETAVHARNKPRSLCQCVLPFCISNMLRTVIDRRDRSAIYHDFRSGDRRSPVRGSKGNEFRHFIGPIRPAERDAAQHIHELCRAAV